VGLRIYESDPRSSARDFEIDPDDDSGLVGRTLGEVDLRNATGASVAAIQRDGDTELSRPRDHRRGR